MRSDLVAQIRIDNGSEDCVVGTGYPIKENLVVTARHVVTDKDAGASAAAVEKEVIRVVWPDVPAGEVEGDAAGHAFQSAVEAIAYDGGEDCDLALLRCNTPPRARMALPSLPVEKPRAHDTWEGWGFPEIGVSDDTGASEKLSILGEFHPPDGHSHKLALTSKSDAIEKRGWCGVSGAPVFQRFTLCGIVVATPTQREETFEAVSIPHLLYHDAAFAAELGFDVERIDLTPAIDCLKKHTSLQNALASRLRAQSQEVGETSEGTVKCLAKLPIPQLLDLVFAVKQSGEAPADAITGLVKALLPTLYARGAIDNIRAAKADGSYTIIEIPYATDVSAELLMAGVDGKPADFRVIRISREDDARYQLRPGHYHVDMPPNSGASSVEQGLNDLTRDLHRRLSAQGGVGELQLALDDALFNKVVRRQQRHYSDEQRREAVRRQLERDAAGSRRGYYWLVPLDACEDEAVANRLRELASRVKSDYPMITLLCLDSSFEQEQREEDLLDPLHEGLAPSE